VNVPHEDMQPIVVVIDDDQLVRDGLDNLLQSVGLRVETFGTIQEFLAVPRRHRFGCLVLDVRLPGRSGLEYLDDLARENSYLPVIVISGHADVPMSVRAMKAGAVEFLTKPIRHQDLLDAIQRAMERDRSRRADLKAISMLQADFSTLTAREREIMALVVAGRPNKEIAARVGISEATVKLHRGQVMRKMQARSLPELVRMADKLGLGGLDQSI
jgi:FixJ family two-component response regulator